MLVGDVPVTRNPLARTAAGGIQWPAYLTRRAHRRGNDRRPPLPPDHPARVTGRRTNRRANELGRTLEAADTAARAVALPLDGGTFTLDELRASATARDHVAEMHRRYMATVAVGTEAAHRLGRRGAPTDDTPNDADVITTAVHVALEAVELADHRRPTDDTPTGTDTVAEHHAPNGPPAPVTSRHHGIARRRRPPT
jgi:hypothetical protein